MKTNTPKVVLVRPDIDVLEKFSKPFESLALGYLAAILRLHNVEVNLIDGMIYHWSNQELAINILQKNPDIIGITIVDNHFPDRVCQLIRLLRESGFNKIILVGGHSVSFMAERILNNVSGVDAVISGEGEYFFEKFIEVFNQRSLWGTVPGISYKFNNKIISIPPRRVVSLESIPLPARDLVPDIIKADGIVTVSTSRGCHARCTFCSIPRFYGLHKGKKMAVGDWVSNDASIVASDFKMLSHKYDVKELVIVDDEFFGGNDLGKKRAQSIALMLISEKNSIHFAMSCRAENVCLDTLSMLKQAGLRHVFVGIETGNEQDLKLYGKQHTIQQNIKAIEVIKSLGLSFQAGMMFFNYNSTMSQLIENLNFLKEVGEFKPMLINSMVDPHFGTPILKAMEKDGVLEDNGLNLSVKILDPKVLLAKKIVEMCINKFTNFFMLIAKLQSSITYEWRRINSARTLDETKLVSNFETNVNQSFCNFIYDTFCYVDKLITIDYNMILLEVEKSLENIVKNLSIISVLLMPHIKKTNGV